MTQAPAMQVELTDEVGTIYIYDPIGSNSFFFDMFGAKDMRDALKQVGERDVSIRINSLGGDAYQAVAMYNLLQDHAGTVTVVVDGIAASAASVIAMAGETVEMRRGSQLMIHEPATVAIGNAAEMESVLQQLRKTTESALDIYEHKTSKSRQSLAKMMADETWLTADEAKQEGFADSVATSHAVALKASSPQMAAACKRYNVPESALALVNSRAEPAQTDRGEVVMSDTPNASEPVENGKTEPDATVSVTADLQAVQPQPQITMSLEDYEKLKNNQKAETPDGVEMTAEEAVAADRKRSREITAKCQAAGIDQPRIDKLIDSGVGMEVVEQIVEMQLIATNAPASDGSDSLTVDEDAEYRKEYQEAVKAGVAMSSTEDEYVNTRRLDDGKSPITLSKKGGE